VKLIAPYSTSSLGAPFHVEQLAKLLPADGFLMGAISEAAVVVRLFHRSGSRLWEQTFPRVGGSFELHQKVITATLDEIAGAAEARVVSSGNYVPSEEGYRAYIAARSAVKGQTDNNLLQAEALFVEAIRHDGGFAHAFSGLGYVLFLMGGARIADARTAISRALALDPDHAEAHMVKSLILHNCDWQWPEALIEIKKALDAEPYNFAVHQVYGGFLCDQGLLEEGLPEIQTAVDYDPLSYTAKFSLGIMSTHARRFDFAIEQLEQSIKIAKDAKVEISRPYNYLGACWLMKGDKLKAYQYYQRGLAAQPADPLTLCHYIFGVAKCGHLTEARAKMDQLLRMPGAAEIPFYTGLAFAGLGDLEKALDYLELAVKKRDSTITTVKIHLYCDPLRNKPRFEAILRSMHLA
jgi:Tfp pilus assembly protein PilF